MNEHFNPEEGVALVITSCNRLHLLDKTIRSFQCYNTYPLAQKIIIEDSGIPEVYEALKQSYGSDFEILFNEKSLGQAASVDRAYSKVNSPYIFHCEDDWEFYRPSFIEDSFVFLRAFPKLKQVLLRSISHDYAVHHSTVTFQKEPIFCEGLRAYQSNMAERFKESDWITHSYNPGLIRKADYELIGTYQGKTEAQIAMYYKQQGFFSAALENDAVLHLGWDDSTQLKPRKKNEFVLKLKHKLKQILAAS